MGNSPAPCRCCVGVGALEADVRRAGPARFRSTFVSNDEANLSPQDMAHGTYLWCGLLERENTTALHLHISYETYFKMTISQHT
jgi:hypothetical protein